MLGADVAVAYYSEQERRGVAVDYNITAQAACVQVHYTHGACETTRAPVGFNWICGRRGRYSYQTPKYLPRLNNAFYVCHLFLCPYSIQNTRHIGLNEDINDVVKQPD